MTYLLTYNPATRGFIILRDQVPFAAFESKANAEEAMAMFQAPPPMVWKPFQHPAGQPPAGHNPFEATSTAIKDALSAVLACKNGFITAAVRRQCVKALGDLK